MPHVQAVCCAVKANVEGGLSVVYQFPDLLLVRDLSNQTAGFQFFINLHDFFSLLHMISIMVLFLTLIHFCGPWPHCTR